MSRILIVDDEGTHRRGAALTLSKLNHEVLEFQNESEAIKYRGHPDMWERIFRISNLSSRLTEAWIQDWVADEIVEKTARYLGWDSHLSQVGYTIDYDGIPNEFDGHYALDGDVDLTGIQKLHFVKNESPS